jgi:hypothetical protein
MRADEFQSVRADTLFWQAYEPAVKCDLSSCARIFGKELVFIDPIPLAADALAELAELATPVAVILTSGNHARAAVKFREKFSIPIHAHAAAVPELGITVDGLLTEGGEAPGGLEVMEIEGAAAGEIALIGGGIAHVGDAVINLEPMGFSLLPDKYCADPRTMRMSLGKLLRFDFELLTFAHGLPLVSHARQRLAQILA